MYHECLLPTWLKSCGTFLRLAVVDWTINIMCRHPALHGQSRADLKVVKWLSNGYELKIKRWPQDGVTKYSGSKDRLDLNSRCRIKKM